MACAPTNLTANCGQGLHTRDYTVAVEASGEFASTVHPANVDMNRGYFELPATKQQWFSANVTIRNACSKCGLLSNMMARITSDCYLT